ncbi:MAG: M20/M25/M40 family metallo-hydrolase, partial [Candidatus Omnitrophica bacterium]|nr:M20/M25/M40 family metallo-hydrolase [Candidatus Omnitrophota bacterium]
DIYSPSGKEKEIVNYTSSFLSKHRIDNTLQFVDKERANIVVNASQKNNFFFAGHLDTVPAFDLLNYKATEKQGQVFGLGAADMKGGCAAMLEAFIHYQEMYGRLPKASLALVVGEEETDDGIMKLISEYQFDWALVGEPTELNIALSHYGYLELEIKTYGVRRHASLASRDHNAIYTLLNILQNLTKFLDKYKKKWIYNIRDVHSSDAGFAVPDKCVALIDLHLPPEVEVNVAKKQLIKELNSYLKGKRIANKDFLFSTVNSGFSLEKDGDLVKKIKSIFKNNQKRWHPVPFKSHSDASFLWEKGIKPIILGPGELAKAHTKNESVSLKQVCEAARIYFEMLCSLDKD